MTVSKTAEKSSEKPAETAKGRKDASEGPGEALQLGELSEQLGYVLKRAQLKVFENFLRCMASLQLTPAQFSVLLLVEKNPGRNQTEIASTLGILRPNFVAMLDNLESRDLCARIRSTNDRRSHILVLTDKGKAVLARAKKLVATKHEAPIERAARAVQPRSPARNALEDRQRVLTASLLRRRSIVRGIASGLAAVMPQRTGGAWQVLPRRGSGARFPRRAREG